MTQGHDVRPGGLRTVIYNVPDLVQAKKWYGELFQRTPYFDESYYVGFNVGGYELGLHPADATHLAGAGGCVAYWGVSDIDATLAHLAAQGVTPQAPPQEVGGGIRVATVRDPFDNVVGLIQNPHFTLTDAPE